ncbi:putative U1 small nuclear ribonucleoprotein A [Pilobolus umbonatus]|nr:putative U1 small nuclear ribonucleoprotein A [Pilobolus umbonatus]
MSTIDPSHTLYITNIPGKINVEELKANLYDLFSTYGPVLDITAKDTYKMREQAFVVYTNIASATTAKRALNGFNFFSKPLVSCLHGLFWY